VTGIYRRCPHRGGAKCISERCSFDDCAIKRAFDQLARIRKAGGVGNLLPVSGYNADLASLFIPVYRP
jgi:hypothetical protein